MAFTLWDASATPTVTAVADTRATELGLRFSSDLDGYVSGVRFYKGAPNVGPHIGTLWTADGTPLARATFTGETASGWQQVDFESPVHIAANTTYVASYYTRSGRYALTDNYFSAAGVNSGPLHAPQDSPSAPNGAFTIDDVSTFPATASGGDNFFVDVVFDTTFAPKVNSVYAFDGEPDGIWDSNVTATFNGAMDPATVNGTTVQLRDGSGAVVPSSVSYDAATRVVTIDPAAPLTLGAPYTVFVQGGAAGVRSITGNPLPANYSSPFNAVETNNYGLWADSVVPPIQAFPDNPSVEVGVRFQPDAAGLITGVRFYKGPGNIGTHVGHLWTAGGTLLASAVFSGETATGWQQVNFSSPVNVTPGTTYVASYLAPTGHYAVEVGGFAAHGVTRGALRVPQDGVTGSNGVYSYSTTATFPNHTVNSNNYWVSPVFYRPVGAPSTPDLLAADDSGDSNSDNLTNAAAPHFTGTARAGATVRILANGVEVGSGVADAQRNYNVAALGLTDGQYDITAAFSDVGPGGTPITVTSPGSLHVTIDRSVGTPPAPDLDPASDSGASNSDNVTAAASLLFAGTADPFAVVTVYSDGAPLGQASANSTGSFQFTAPGLADGVHSITASATDAAGNVSVASPALQVTVDRSISTPSEPDLDASADTGASDSDDLTAAASLLVVGTAEPGSAVTLFDEGVSIGQVTADGSGNYQFTASGLADGVHHLTTQALDAAGNLSAVSTALAVTVDRSAPGTPATPDLDASADTGASDTDNVTAATSLIFTGTAEPGSTVTLFSDGASIGQATADGGGQYSLTASSLAAGAHAITASSQDAAGNVSSASGALSVTVDRSIATPSALDLQAASDTGSSSTDNVTGAASLVFDGTAEPGALVTVFSDGVSIGTATANGSGNYAFTAASLSEGVHQITAQATDAAGNLSAVSASLSVTVDRSVPTADVVDVSPDPRATAVASAQVTFSEPVTGVSLSSLRLFKDGVLQSLTGATLTGPAGDGRTYTVGNLTQMTSIAGTYELRFVAAGSNVRDAAGNALAADASDTWVMTTSLNVIPTIGTLTPGSDTSAPGVFRTFAATYRDLNGAADLAQVYFRLNEFVPNELSLLYDIASNKLFMLNDAGTAFTGGFAPGSPNVIATTHGQLDCAATTVSSSGNQMTVNWRLAAGQKLTGLNTLYLRARDKSAADSNYQRIGAGFWTVTGNAAPTVSAPAPLSATTAPGVAQSFSVTYSDPDGWENLRNVYFRVNADLPWMMDCIYDVPSNRLYMRDSTTGGVLGGFAPGTAHTITNRSGSLNCAAVTVTGSGADLTINWNVSATQHLAGPNLITTRARDNAGADTFYVQSPGAVWNVGPDSAPTNFSLAGQAPATTPAGQFRVMFAAYNDPDGPTNLTSAFLRITNSNTGNQVRAVFNQVTNKLFLVDAANKTYGGFAPGSAHVITTDDGSVSLNCAATVISASGTRLLVNWSLACGASMAGTNTFSLRCIDRGNIDTGFVAFPAVIWTITT